MWALTPDTEGVSCGLGGDVDRLCREPQLRGLRPNDLARALEISPQRAQAAILRLASYAVKRPLSGVRGRSFDEAISQAGRPAKRQSIIYSPDAAGGFGTPASPTVLPPGVQDPRTRSFTASMLDPVLVAKYGEEAVRGIGYSGLVPPPEDLDRVAIFSAPPIDWPGNMFQWPGGPSLVSGIYPKWSDIQTAGQTELGRPDLDAVAVKGAIGWWRQAFALGPLPEDSEGEAVNGSVAYDWPRVGDNRERRIYFWGFGKDGRLYKHMQVQKFDTSEKRFRIFNKWSQDLTFVYKDNPPRWEAGWDFGDWLTQNKMTISTAIQLAAAAILTVVSLGAAAAGNVALATSIGLATAAQRAFVSGMTGLATGNWDQALQSFIAVTQNMAKLPITAEGAPKIPEELKQLAENPALKSFASIVKDAQSSEVGQLIQRAVELARTKQVTISPNDVAAAKALVPAELQIWFDRAFNLGAGAPAQRGAVPWYALPTYDFATVLGTAANPPQQGSRSVVIQTGPDLRTLEQQLADAIAIAKIFCDKGRPECAYAQSKVEELKASVERAKTMQVLTPKTATAPILPSGAAVPVAVGGGLLALLFFL